MKIEIIICDKCDRGNEDGVSVSSYRVNRGREIDPSGNGYNIKWEYVDLCNDCYPTFVANLKGCPIGYY
jgi:hypothetical protein